VTVLIIRDEKKGFFFELIAVFAEVFHYKRK
jgi:hypothetical protein